jgi:hypothetical protein
MEAILLMATAFVLGTYLARQALVKYLEGLDSE